MKRFFKTITALLLCALLALSFAGCGSCFSLRSRDGDDDDNDTEDKAIRTRYTVTFDSKGGDFTAPLAGVKHGSVISAPAENPERIGYRFFGWFKESECVDEWIFNSDEVTGNLTLYAKWTANTYTIVYNANGGDGIMEPSLHTYGTAKNLSLNTYTSDVYMFAGWNTLQDGGGTGFADGAEVLNITDINEAVCTLFARWAVMGAVSFNANGGTGNMPDQPVEIDETNRLNSCAFSRTGYTFTGWAETSGGTVLYTDGADFTMESQETVILYAIWQANAYSVAYNSNNTSASGSTQNSQHIYDVSKNLNANGYSLAGFAFVCWTENANGTGTQYGDSQSVLNLTALNGAAVTLYAKWASSTAVTVSFDRNNGIGTANPKTVQTGAAYGALPAGVTRAGFSFAGWWTGEGGTGTEITAQTTVTIAAAHTLYARWENINGFSSGTGSAENPYIIFTKEQLTYLRDQSNTYSGIDFTGVHLSLGRSIDLDGAEWTPIGKTPDGRGFGGVFNGNNYTVSNFIISQYIGTAGYIGSVGLFGQNGGTIRSLRVADFDIQIQVPASIHAMYAGGLAGYSSGTIENCHAEGSISITKTGLSVNGGLYAGGLIGFNCGSIAGSSAACEVDAKTTRSGIGSFYGHAYAGGLCGIINNGIIAYCFAEGNTKAETTGLGFEAFAGGLIGISDYGKILNSYSLGTVSAVSGASVYAGGFTGQNTSYIAGCYSECAVSVSSSTVLTASKVCGGGFVGSNGGESGVSAVKIESCHAKGGVTVLSDSYAYAGGFAGFNGGKDVLIPAEIIKSYATGDVTSITNGMFSMSSYAGGFVGYDDQGPIKECYAEGGAGAWSESYFAYAGGFMGRNDNGFIENCYAKGDAFAQTTSSHTAHFAYAGGFAGRAHGNISKCYAAGDAEAKAVFFAYAGGFCGALTENNVNANMLYPTGLNVPGIIDSCYSAGAAEAASVSGVTVYAGGFLGDNVLGSSTGLYGTLTKCYRSNSMGSFGINMAWGTVTPSFYTATLGFSTAVWDLSEFALTGFPRLGSGAEVITVASAVSFSANGGSGAPSNVTAVYGGEMPVITAKPVRSGYTFLGFFDSAGRMYYDASLTGVGAWDKVNSTVVLSAKWQGMPYTVSFDKQGGEGSAESKTVHYGSEYGTLPIVTKEGHTFGGWWTAADGSGSVITASANVYITANQILYAYWAANEYTVTLDASGGSFCEVIVEFNLNGASGAVPASQTITAATGLVYPANPSRSGYIFAGWYNNSLCEGQPFDFSDSVSENKTLYAKWIAPSGYTDVIYTNGSITSISFNTTIKYYAYVPLVSGNVVIYSTNVFGDPYGYLYNSSKVELDYNDDGNGGYNFRIEYYVTAGTLYYIGYKSYSAGTAGTGSLYVTGAAVPGTGGKAGTVLTKTLTVTYGQQYGGFGADPVFGDYVFDGWYTLPGGNGTRISNLDIVNVPSNQTLYACWLEVFEHISEEP